MVIIVGQFNNLPNHWTHVLFRNLWLKAQKQSFGKHKQKENLEVQSYEMNHRIEEQAKEPGVRKDRNQWNSCPLWSSYLVSHRKWWIISGIMIRKSSPTLFSVCFCHWFWNSNSKKKVWWAETAWHNTHCPVRRYLDYQYVMTLPNGAKLSPITPTRCKCILERKNNPNLHMALLVFPSQGWRVGINTVYR